MQSFMVAQAAASLLLAAALLLYVGSIRPRSASHWALIAALAAIVSWDTGALLAWARPEGVESMRWAARLGFLGACFTGPLVLYLAARMARVVVVEERPRTTAAALLVPSGLLLLAVLTNDWHGLFARALTFEVFSDPPSRWAGPLFWVLTLWSYGTVCLAVVISLSAAARTRDETERKRLWLLAAGVLVPVVPHVARTAGLLPAELSLTYVGHAVTGLLLVAAIARYQFLDFPIPAREVISHLHDGLVLIEPGGRILDANAAAGQLLGTAPEALRGSALADLLARLAPASELGALLEHSEGVSSRSITTRMGKTVDVSLGWIGARRAGPRGRFLLLADRTEQRRREQQQWRAQRLESLGVLAAGISHEVSNPLAFLRANLSHAIETLSPTDRLAGAPPEKIAAELAELTVTLEESLEGAERITAIVEATRRLAQPPRQDGARIDVERVVDDAIRLASLYRPDPVRVERRRGEGVPGVIVSEGELGQVVLNLVLNAKQSLRGAALGRILVETDAAAASGAPWALIRVHDNGPGVAETDREKIFDPFFTTRGPTEGMGLGLAICHQIVHVHGGSIEVDTSPSLGGACFLIRLPAASGAGAFSEGPAPTPRPGGSARPGAREA
jgi:signal transduction histidine kinase